SPLRSSNNTGYKHADPSRPCHKCWARYARPYPLPPSLVSFPPTHRPLPLPRERYNQGHCRSPSSAAL
ncbi:hypothetical protein B0H12DRAFT_1159296, partial [Mycena haematopus]